MHEIWTLCATRQKTAKILLTSFRGTEGGGGVTWGLTFVPVCTVPFGCPKWFCCEESLHCCLIGCVDWQHVENPTNNHAPKRLTDCWVGGKTVQNENIIILFSLQQSKLSKMKIDISYWPSARAVMGEYRPEVLAVRTEPLRRGPYKKDRGPIFSQYGPSKLGQ